MFVFLFFIREKKVPYLLHDLETTDKMFFFTLIDTLYTIINKAFSLLHDGLNKHTHTHIQRK